MVLRERGLADEEEGKGFFDKGLYRKLPLPSNAMLLNTDLETGKNFLFIPVLDQPLSSNRYYARFLFENSKEIDEISWNALISGLWYKHGCRILCGKVLYECIMKLGYDIDIVVGTSLLDIRRFCLWKANSRSNIQWRKTTRPDEFTISNILNACADLTTARLGEQIPLIRHFKRENPDVVSWSVMICSCTQHGCATDALNLFGLMKECGIKPNHITSVGVLSACSYGGLVEEGLKSILLFYANLLGSSCASRFYFFAFIHDNCVVNLLTEAENFILTSGFKNNPIMWRALLSACRVYKDTVTGNHAAMKVIELEPQESASYVPHNIYAGAVVEPLAASVRELMQQ
ncbi:hypothetical protein V6N11_046964 [Hibiscus sabdariffa]|uniref:Pentatricopeptide repeat-containing protein n=1 Tax=Hibiscus sabdariffa TaxID=183260 RepID=A0ABR2NCX5_9ROSI